MNLSADTEMRVVEAPTRQVDLAAAGRLRLDTDVVYRIVFTRSHDAVPFVLTTVWWPAPVAELIADRPEVAAGAVSEHTMIGLLEPHLTEPITECVQSITASTADARVSEVLGCPVGHPVLRVDRLYNNSAARASNWRSATSCPSTTPTESLCAAPRAAPPPKPRAVRRARPGSQMKATPFRPMRVRTSDSGRVPLGLSRFRRASGSTSRPRTRISSVPQSSACRALRKALSDTVVCSMILNPRPASGTESPVR